MNEYVSVRVAWPEDLLSHVLASAGLQSDEHATLAFLFDGEFRYVNLRRSMREFPPTYVGVEWLPEGGDGAFHVEATTVEHLMALLGGTVPEMVLVARRPESDGKGAKDDGLC